MESTLLSTLHSSATGKSFTAYPTSTQQSLKPGTSPKRYLSYSNVSSWWMEHMVLLIPLIWLKVCIKKRSDILQGSIFKEVPDELLSTRNVNLLLTFGVLVTFVTPILQAVLAYAYFKFGHPWARVLKPQVFSPTEGEVRNDSSEADFVNKAPEKKTKSVAHRDQLLTIDEQENVPGHNEESDQKGIIKMELVLNFGCFKFNILNSQF